MDSVVSLAEPRKRRKNPMHSLNMAAPNHWTNDDSKFGQRMLEKFGWSKGSGLGKNKQGISENIRVDYKCKPTGIGFVANNADDWFKASEDYSHLLSQLTEKFDQYQALTVTNDSSKKSLEQNSLNSKSRVHYHKFAKGKDLTQYKKDELACIVGKGMKDYNESAKGLDMIEYFKTKQKNKKIFNQQKLMNNEDSIVKNDGVIEEIIVDKGVETNTHVDQYEINTTTPKKKKSKKLLINQQDLLNNEDPIVNNDVEVKEKIINNEVVDTDTHADQYEINTTTPKKKKSKKLLISQQDLLNNEDPIVNNDVEVKEKIINDEVVDTDTHANQHDINTTIQKKKKSKKTFINQHGLFNNEESVVNNAVDVNEKISENQHEISTPPKKKKRQSKHLKEFEILPNTQSLDKTNVEQVSENVLTHKYQHLVDLIIENSSSGKKYSKNPPNPLFDKKMKEFEESVHQCITNVGSVEKTDGNLTSYKPKILNPDDKDFVKDFEAQQLKAMETVFKRQEVSKYVNDKSMFIAKHGNELFFGSNLNDIKGYGDW